MPGTESEVADLKEIRDNYNVAHSPMRSQVVEAGLEDVSRCRKVARKAIGAYIVFEKPNGLNLRSRMLVDPESICRQNCWRLSVRRPRTNNPEREFVAHVYEDDEAVGLWMSAYSALAASVYTVQSSLKSAMGDIDRDQGDFTKTLVGFLEWDRERNEIAPKWDRYPIE